MIQNKQLKTNLIDYRKKSVNILNFFSDGTSDNSISNRMQKIIVKINSELSKGYNFNNDSSSLEIKDNFFQSIYLPRVVDLELIELLENADKKEIVNLILFMGACGIFPTEISKMLMGSRLKILESIKCLAVNKYKLQTIILSLKQTNIMSTSITTLFLKSSFHIGENINLVYDNLNNIINCVNLIRKDNHTKTLPCIFMGNQGGFKQRIKDLCENVENLEFANKLMDKIKVNSTAMYTIISRKKYPLTEFLEYLKLNEKKLTREIFINHIKEILNIDENIVAKLDCPITPTSSKAVISDQIKKFVSSINESLEKKEYKNHKIIPPHVSDKFFRTIYYPRYVSDKFMHELNKLDKNKVVELIVSMHHLGFLPVSISSMLCGSNVKMNKMIYELHSNLPLLKNIVDKLSTSDITAKNISHWLCKSGVNIISTMKIIFERMDKIEYIIQIINNKKSIIPRVLIVNGRRIGQRIDILYENIYKIEYITNTLNKFAISQSDLFAKFGKLDDKLFINMIDNLHVYLQSINTHKINPQMSDNIMVEIEKIITPISGYNQIQHKSNCEEFTSISVFSQEYITFQENDLL